ncbi:hypothetical protein OE88DRAFT_1665023 [Heliocybe sulcata]|uniref:Zinc-finger domain-containing protein n=1 Tax=Heliocybe sulcata TaxID=5364 RepID=A0A5C3MSX1_9AGAM|nr:hypothetical protein OE88DRAFT_1665023 [Heliocybe sulcata]
MPYNNSSELLNWDGSLDRHQLASSDSSSKSRSPRPRASYQPLQVDMGYGIDAYENGPASGDALDRRKPLDTGKEPEVFPETLISMPMTDHVPSDYVRDSSSLSVSDPPRPKERTPSPFLPVLLLPSPQAPVPSPSQNLTSHSVVPQSTSPARRESSPIIISSDSLVYTATSPSEYRPSPKSQSPGEKDLHWAYAPPPSQRAVPRLGSICYISVPPLPPGIRKDDYMFLNEYAKRDEIRPYDLLNAMQVSFQSNAVAAPLFTPGRKRNRSASLVPATPDSSGSAIASALSPKPRRRRLMVYPASPPRASRFERVLELGPPSEEGESLAERRLSMRHLLRDHAERDVAMDYIKRRRYQDPRPHQYVLPSSPHERLDFVQGSSTMRISPPSGTEGVQSSSPSVRSSPGIVETPPRRSTSPPNASITGVSSIADRVSSPPESRDAIEQPPPHSPVHLDDPPGSEPVIVENDPLFADISWGVSAMYQIHGDNAMAFVAGTKSDVFLGTGNRSPSPEELRIDHHYQGHAAGFLGTLSSTADVGEGSTPSLDPDLGINSAFIDEPTSSSEYSHEIGYTLNGTINPSILGGFDASESPESPRSAESASEPEDHLPDARLRSFSPDSVASESSRSRASAAGSEPSPLEEPAVLTVSPTTKRMGIVLCPPQDPAEDRGSSMDEHANALDPGDSMYDPEAEDRGALVPRGKGKGRARVGGRTGQTVRSKIGSVGRRHITSRSDAAGLDGPQLSEGPQNSFVSSKAESGYHKLWNILFNALDRYPGGRAGLKDPDGELIRCHHCRRSTDLLKMTCRTMHGGVRCMKRYCVNCILKRYPDIQFDANAVNFKCPVCRGDCNCSVCSGLRGEVYISERDLRRIKMTGKGKPKKRKAKQPAMSKEPAGRIKSQVPPEPGTFFGTVYGLDGERVGAAFMASLAHPLPPRERIFIGTPLDSWHIDPEQYVDQEDPVFPTERPLFLGDISHLNIASYRSLDEIKSDYTYESSLSSLTELSDDDDDKDGVLAGPDKAQDEWNTDNAVVGESRLNLGLDSLALERVMQMALAAVQPEPAQVPEQVQT